MIGRETHADDATVLDVPLHLLVVLGEGGDVVLAGVHVVVGHGWRRSVEEEAGKVSQGGRERVGRRTESEGALLELGWGFMLGGHTESDESDGGQAGDGFCGGDSDSVQQTCLARARAWILARALLVLGVSFPQIEFSDNCTATPRSATRNLLIRRSRAPVLLTAPHGPRDHTGPPRALGGLLRKVHRAEHRLRAHQRHRRAHHHPGRPQGLRQHRMGRQRPAPTGRKRCCHRTCHVRQHPRRT